jgi:DNA polymerase-3 subunit epsilon
MTAGLPSRLCIVDVETTGTTATADRVTEVGIVTVVDGQVFDEWSSLVNPRCSIPAEIQALTGITNDMVRDAPDFADIASHIRVRLDDAVFVAHNARFDYGFLKNEFRRIGDAFSADVLCTVRLSRRLYPQFSRHGLDQLRERHQLTSDGRHRALGDARAAWQFISVAHAEHGADAMAAAVKSLLKMPSLPPQLAVGVLDDLPEGPGVYTFYGVNDLPIYIGKSVNLRDRIRSHFSSDHRSANDLRLSSEITRIEVEETAGELGALLREIALIKSRMPLRNHRLRRNAEACFVRLRDLNALPEFPLVDEIDFSDDDAREGLFGPISSRARAKDLLSSYAAEHELCWHVVRAKPGNGACFGRQLKRCRGYCVGQESIVQHNLRLVEALAERKLPAWPWTGRIAVREVAEAGSVDDEGARASRVALHVFDRWCLVGTASSDAELSELRAAPAAPFDADIFKLLWRYLQDAPDSVVKL